MSARLVLVTAPAGWGKTSLLRDWCASGGVPRQAADLTAGHDLGGYWMNATAITTPADLLAGRGRLAEAKEAALHALALARRGRARPETARELLCLARISSQTGDTDDARAHINEVRGIIARCPEPGILGGLLTETERLAGLRAHDGRP